MTRTAPRRACSWNEAVELVGRIRMGGGRIVFTNGVFDLLHPGHVRYLQQARRLGEGLIVGLNSDQSARAIKGPDRPITPEDERAEVLLALECVDVLALFDQETPDEIIRHVQPDILVKGSDWAADSIVGRETVENRGGRVVRIELAPGYSTTDVIRRVRSRTSPE